MQRFRNKNELVVWLSENAPYRAISRAAREGVVELWGWFSAIPPNNAPGWIFQITSRYGRSWVIAVRYKGIPPRLHAWVCDTIPWECWIGDQSPTSDLRLGDRPEWCKTMRTRKRKDYLDVKQVATSLRTRFKFDATPATVRTWITKGTRTRSGNRRIKLQAHKKYGRWYIAPEWLDTFIRKVAESNE